jgi:hypothetical protein
MTILFVMKKNTNILSDTFKIIPKNEKKINFSSHCRDWACPVHLEITLQGKEEQKMLIANDLAS